MPNDEKQDVDLENNELELDLEAGADDQKDWKAEALKYQAIAKRKQEKLDKLGGVSSPQVINKQEPKEAPREVRASDILKADEFKLYRMGYNEDEIDLIMRNGGAGVLKDEKNPLVIGLRTSREQRQAEEAASKTQESSGASEIERKYTKADLDKMSVSELEKILPHAN